MAQQKRTPGNPSAQQTKRGQLRAQQQAVAHAKRRHRIIGLVAVIVVVALVLVALVVWHPGSRPAGTTTPTTGVTAPDTNGTATTGTPTATGSPTMYIPPNGTDQMGWIQVTSSTTKPNALVVNEHIDYQCPICEQVDTYYGSAMRTLAERGDIILRIHIRTFLDGNLGNDSSQRAAMAATCADTVGDFIAYHEVVFANQPTTEGAGYTDQQLRVDFAQQAGITGDKLTQFQSCYDTQKTLPYVQAMEQVNLTSTTINGATQPPPSGTPAIYVNGVAVTLSNLGKVAPQDPDALLAFLQTTAGVSA